MKISERYQAKKSIEAKISAIKSEISTINLPGLAIKAGDARTRYESARHKVDGSGDRASERSRSELAALKDAMEKAKADHQAATDREARLKKELHEAVAALESIGVECSANELKALQEKINEVKLKIEEIAMVQAGPLPGEKEQFRLYDEAITMETELENLLADQALGVKCDDKIAALKEKLAENQAKAAAGPGDLGGVISILGERVDGEKGKLLYLQEQQRFALNGYLIALARETFEEYRAAADSLKIALSTLYALAKVQEQVSNGAVVDPIVKSWHPVKIPAVIEPGNVFDSSNIDRADAVEMVRQKIQTAGIKI
ncbi:hypothetical protein [Trichloromonas acetexigens]|uniref:Uncharacterized protein n=1 Tax=Trichloromonas acetexigens TaxID=38815 RepID=A0A550J2U1_9BACT|nr:hypothetical protein [Desulfuromonas acetexigens]TRO77518.1 hypothetical protein FL622_17175 [Desulfuromonas acetexigens]